MYEINFSMSFRNANTDQTEKDNEFDTLDFPPPPIDMIFVHYFKRAKNVHYNYLPLNGQVTRHL